MSDSTWTKPTAGDAEPPFLIGDSRRTTYDLVETCIITLILCSWTSIHLDIPGKNDRHHHLRAIWQKVQWTITGILCPEMVFWEARWLCFELEKLKKRREREVGGRESQATSIVNETKPESAVVEICIKCGSSKCVTEDVTNRINSANHLTPESTLSRIRRQMKELRKHKQLFNFPIYPKRLEVGFFVEMGGLEIDVLDPSNATNGQVASSNFDVTGRVTSSGALLLQEAGLFPLLDIDRVNDQSKTDLLTKPWYAFSPPG